MDIPAQFTRRTLAQFCDLCPSSIDKHIRANTLNLGKAVEKIPGLGVRIQGSKARRFIEAMAANRSQTTPA